MDYCRAVALSCGHSPERIDAMPVRDLELLVAYDSAALRMPFVGGE